MRRRQEHPAGNQDDKHRRNGPDEAGKRDAQSRSQFHAIDQTQLPHPLGHDAAAVDCSAPAGLEGHFGASLATIKGSLRMVWRAAPRRAARGGARRLGW